METERDKARTEYIGYLRAEASMVDSEEGTDCTTRACLLRGAADEIEQLNRLRKEESRLYVKAMNTTVDLEQRLAAAEAALQPFAKVAADIDPKLEDYMAHHYDHLVGHYRAAAEAAKGGRDGTPEGLRTELLKCPRPVLVWVLELVQRLAAAEEAARWWRMAARGYFLEEGEVHPDERWPWLVNCSESPKSSTHACCRTTPVCNMDISPARENNTQKGN